MIDDTLVHKKVKDFNRTLSILPGFIKGAFITKFKFTLKTISRYQSSFRKGYIYCATLTSNTDRKRQKTVDRGDPSGALLTKLSKEFDCLPYEFLNAKLDACGFEINSLRLIYDYLSSRKQRVKLTPQLDQEKNCMIYQRGHFLDHCFFKTFFFVTCSTSSNVQT